MLELRPMPYNEAIDFFKKRTVMTPSEFETVTAGANNAAKARAFTISGVARMDVLNDVYNSIEKAIANGETFGDFRNRIDDIMVNRGWEGLTPHHLDNIFRTNIQTSYMAGRHEQMKRISKRRPFWQYDAVNDSRTRPTHAEMDGKVYPHDHPFWKTWYPPNGYR
ncbi:MAG: phage minor head protein [Pseudomonadota bacterium]